MTTISFLGSGRISTSIAHLAVRSGLPVVLSNSRGPETLADLVAELGDRARAATADEAAAAGNIVVLAVPFKHLHDIDPAPLDGKIVVDATNYFPDRDGAFPDHGVVTSSQLVQRHLANSRVVKTLNNIRFDNLVPLARPSGHPERSVLPLAGDNRAAKLTVSLFLDVLGFDSYDAGPLAEGRRFDPGSHAWVEMYGGTTDVDDPGTPTRVTRSELASRLGR